MIGPGRLIRLNIENGTVNANGLSLHYLTCVEGAPLVLLHGWPQTSYSWRKLLPILAPHYRCVAPDLRGLGESDKPADGYDMRTVANDIHAMCEAMGLENVYLVGADWGGLVARRFALDRPGVLDRVCIVDIVPHDQIFANFTPAYARRAWHYFFNAVPDMPEQLVAHDIALFLKTMLQQKYHDTAIMTEAIDEYVRAYSKPGALRGGFAYYKAMFDENPSIDAENPAAQIIEPVHCVWGNSGGMGESFDVLDMWASVAPILSGRGLDECGHYVHEEQPNELAKEIIAFGKR